MAVRIETTPNGPYIVEGQIELRDAAGRLVNTSGKDRVALCRCGGSTKKPFCDGNHSKLGFKAAEAAVQDAELRGNTGS